MDNKLGEFIKSLRSKNGYSQGDLAKMLGTTRQSVSKWENGLSDPNVLFLKKLSKIFNITVDELVNGKEEEPIKEKTFQNKKLTKIIFICLLTIFIIIFFLLLIYFINNINNVKVYRINGKSDNFILHDTILVVSKENIILKYGNLEYMKEIIDSSKEIKIELYVKKGEEYSSVETYYSDIQNIVKEKAGANNIFSKLFLDNLEFLMLNIEYTNLDGEIIDEQMSLKFDKIASSNKFIYFKNRATEEPDYGFPKSSKYQIEKKLLLQNNFVYCTVKNNCNEDSKDKMILENNDYYIIVEFEDEINITLNFKENKRDSFISYLDNIVNVDTSFYSGIYDPEKDDKKFDKSISKEDEKNLKTYINELLKIVDLLGI